jgi:predicted transcriptional regulator
MKNLLLCILLTLTGLQVRAQIQYEWSQKLGAIGTTNDYIFASTTDANGNVYIAGQITGTSTSTIAIPYSGFTSAQDGFIAKLDAQGNVIWVKTMPSTSAGVGRIDITGLAVGATGNVFFSGRVVSGNVDIDPGPAGVPAYSGWGVVGCLDANGIFLWGGPLQHIPYIPSVKLRPNGDPVFAASFFNNSGTIDLDYSPANNGLSVSNTGVRYGPILLFYSAAGAYQSYAWPTTTQPPLLTPIIQGGPSNFSEDAIVSDLEIDANGDYIILVNSPWYQGAGIQGRDMFVFKFNTAGTLTQTARIASTLTTSWSGSTLSLDANGNVYVVGTFAGPIDFDPGAANVTQNSCLVSRSAGYVLKLNSSFAYQGFAKIQYDQCGTITAADQVNAYDIGIVGSNVFVTGSFTGACDFNPGAATQYLTATGSDAYLLKLDTSLVYQEVFKFGSSTGTLTTELGRTLSVTPNNEIYVSGGYTADITDVNPGAPVVPITINGQQDAFFIKFFQCTPSISITTQPQGTTICAGQPLNLSVVASGSALTYQWRKGGNNIPGATSSTFSVPSAAPTDAGGYEVVISSVCAPSVTSNAVAVTVSSAPAAAVTGTNTICTGGSTTLTASGGGTYLWSNASTTAAITVSPAATTTYTVTVSNGSGCTATATRTVTVNAAPTAAVTGTNTICAGASTTLTASGGGTYLWSNASTTAAITVSPGATTTYTVTVTNNGCTATASRAVTVNTAPAAAVAGTNTICAGASTTLTASGGGTYLWSNASTTAAITVSPGATTTYTVTVTNANGCTATATRTVTVNALPSAAVAGTNTICNGASTTLTASGGGTYLWSNASTTAAITVSPTATTTYTVTVTNASGCTATANRAVTVNANPTAAITGTNTICSGLSTTLTASGGTSYLWSTGATTAALPVSPASTTTYTVTVTNANGCTASASQAVTVNSTPSASVSGTNTICNGASTTLTATGGGTYTWSNAATTAAITVSPSTTTTYTVTVSLGGGCTATATRTVTVNALPTAAVTGTNTICSGASTTLTASGGGTYSWSNASTTAAITVSPTSTTTYTVTVTNANGCTATANSAVTVNALPSAAVTGTNTICNGASTTLTASGGGTYLWSNAATTAAITVSPTSTTTFTVTVTNANGCTATANRAVTVNALPTAAVAGTNTICAGASTTLTASGGGTYVWSNAATTAAITVSPTTTTTYTVTVTNANGCTATANRAVTVNALPSAAINGPTTLCAGLSATLTASGGGTYLWSNAATTAAITVTPASTTTYTVTVTNANACTASASQSVSVNASPTASITGTNTVCAGASTSLTANGGNTYTWSNGSTTATISVSPATTTTYTVTVSLGANCTATSSSTVTVNSNPSPAVTGTNTICTGASTTLNATGGTAYTWSNGATTASITVSPTSTTTYTVTASNANGCTATTTRTVTVNALPTASITGTSSICTGTSTSLTASGGTSYLWSNAATTATISVSPTSNTSYTVTVTNANACTATASQAVQVNALPTISITGNSNLCAGESTSLTATGGLSYAWSNGATNASITLSPSSTSSFSVTATDANGCTASNSQNIVVNALPTPAITGNNSICQGASTVLSVSGNATFVWNNGQTNSSITVSPTVQTSYSVTATNAAGCTATASSIVNVNDNPVPSISGNNTICAGASSTLTVNLGQSFVWSNGGTNASITVSPTSNETYTVTVTDANTCQGTASFNLTVNALPVAQALAADESPCSYSDNGSVDLSLTGNAPFNYLWSDGSTDEDLSGLIAGTYNCTITDANGCITTATATVNEPLPFDGTVSTSANTICRGDVLTLTAAGGATYAWSNGQTNASFQDAPTQTTTYSVVISSAAGCTDNDQVTVNVNDLPNPVITLVGNELDPGTFASYQWYFEGQIIGGATGPTYTPAQNGNYTVMVTNANGCDSTSAPFNVTFIGIEWTEQTAWSMYPNPTHSMVYVKDAPMGAMVRVYNATGQLITQVAVNTTVCSLDMSELPAGVYSIQVADTHKLLIKD